MLQNTVGARSSDLKSTPEAALALAGLEDIYSGRYAKTLTAAGLIIYGLSVNHLRQDPKEKYFKVKSSGLKKKKSLLPNTVPLSFVTLEFLPEEVISED